MRKFLLTTLTLMLAWTAMFAVPAKRNPFTMTQSDGGSLTLMMMGDEWGHGYVTADDRLAVAINDNGDYCYVVAGKPSAMLAHDTQWRTTSEQAFINANREVMGLQPTAMRIAREEANDDPQVPCMGSPRIPIILVNYTDVQFVDDDPVATFQDQFNTKELSCLNYFKDQSRDQFTPQFDILGPVMMDTVRSFYGSNDSYGYDKQLGTMVVEACEGLQDSIDFSVYDNDGDGYVDVVIVLYAGVGEAQAYRTVPSSVWPCQWNLDECYQWGYSTKGAFDLNGVTINKFAVFNELEGSSNNGTTIDGIGTFCHEFSHCLGLPDFYCTNNSNAYGMDSWSLMDYGCYNGGGNVPVGYDAYERHFMGWMDLIDPTPGTRYSLEAINAGGDAVKIVNDANSDEYYLVEYRRKTKWDTYLAATGLMVTHVDYNKSAWTGNTVNNVSSHQRMTIIPADGKLSSSTNKGDLWPYQGLDSLTNNSSPAASVFTGSYMNKPIYDMAIDTGSATASFTYMTAASSITGDVNGDGEVTIADVNVIIDIILGTEADEETLARADVNGDGEVTIADVNAVVDIILNSESDS